MRRFIGRKSERSDLERAVRNRDVRWITGPAGIGKTQLVRECLAGKNTIELDGAWMTKQVDAVECFSQLLGSHPTGTTSFELARWLAAGLPRLASERGVPVDALVVDDFHLMDRGLATVFLRVLTGLELRHAVILLSQEAWSEPGFLSNRVRQVRLWELSEEEVGELCASHGAGTSDLPREVVGHPLLMRLFFEQGVASTQEWMDELVRSLVEFRPVLKMLCLVETPLQLQWVREHCTFEILEKLAKSGAWQEGRPLLTPLRERLFRILEESGERPALESRLLAFLMAREQLSGRDLASAIQIAERAGARDVFPTLIAKCKSSGQLALLQPALLKMLRRSELSAAEKLGAYRALTEHLRIHELEDLLAIHDTLIGSDEEEDRRLAQVCFLRAVFMSGLKAPPPITEQYWRDILEARNLPHVVKEQVVHLWAFRKIHLGPMDTGSRDRMLELLREMGAPDRGCHGLALLYEAVNSCWQFRINDAIPKLEQSRSAFEQAGMIMHSEWSTRYLLVLYYLKNRDDQVKAMLDRIEQSPHGNVHREFWVQFFKTAVAWSQGNYVPLLSQCPSTTAGIARNALAALPGPYFRDFFPYCFLAIRQRDLLKPPDVRLVDLLTEALARLHLFVPLTLSAVVLAQHCLLFEDKESFAKVKSSLLCANPVAAMHAALLSSFEQLESTGADCNDLIALLERATLVTERLTTPYYVVLAVRHASRNGLGNQSLSDYLSRSTPLKELCGLPRFVVDACIASLKGDDKELAAIPLPLRNLIQGRLDSHGPEAGASFDATVAETKRHIDDNWFDELNLAELALKHGVSRFSLTRRFKAKLGVSPKQYQQRQKIEHAKLKLIETDWDVTAISYECGFCDAPQFARMFKRITGLTPSQFRNTWGARDSRRSV
ncbi:MAG: helix-turn-helix domain-containing protein [Deltaproteobacteria bacterium]|nr:helix-turn-helix domain-containing protein [Deltaproteobacteria bacterium]